MTEHDLDPLDDDLRALLRGATGVPPAPAAARARVLAGVEAALGPPGGGGSPGEAPRPPAAAATARGTLLGHGTLLRRGLPLAASFALGAGVATLVAHSFPSPRPRGVGQGEGPQGEGPPRIVYVEGPAPPASPPPPSPVAAPVPPGASTTAPRPAKRAAPSPSMHAATPAPVPSADGLEAERALLDEARGALERERFGDALAATQVHARQFPDGVLAQEREAIAIRALAGLAQAGDARARAARFHERFPDSLLWPTIESTVANLPAP